MPAASAAGSSASMAMPARPSAVVGMPSTPIVRAITLAPYLAASCMTLSQAVGVGRGRVEHGRLLADLEARLHGREVGGVERERDVDDLLHRLDDPRHDLVAELLLRADVEVDDAGAGLDLAPRPCAWMVLASRASMAAFTGGAMMWMFSPMMSTGGLLLLGCGERGVDDRLAAPRSAGCRPAGRRAACRRRRTRRPAGRPGSDGEQVEAVLGDRRLELGREALGGAVDDQVVLARPWS